VKTPKRNRAGKDFSNISGIFSDFSPADHEMSSRARRFSGQNRVFTQTGPKAVDPIGDAYSPALGLAIQAADNPS
jgi:hypothetical protein